MAVAARARLIDLHCHILPGLDDGPATVAESLALARRAVELGTATVVATPHVSWLHAFEPASVREHTVEFQRELRAAAIPLEVVPGAEIALTRLTSLDDGELRALCLGDGPYVLINAPYAPMAELLEQMLAELRSRGFRSILAHPERSPSLQADPDRIDRLVESGVLCSITAGSLTGDFGEPARALALSLFERGAVHNLASDAHGARTRPPGLGESLEILGAGPEQVDWLVSAMPRAILSGAELPPAPRRRVDLRPGPGPPAAAAPVAAATEPVPPEAGVQSSGARRMRPPSTRPRRRVLAIAGIAVVAALALSLAARSGGRPAPTPDRASPGAAPRPASIAVVSYDGSSGGGQASAEAFDAHVEALASAGFEAIDADTFVAAERGQRVALPRRPVLLAIPQRTVAAIDADRILARHRFHGVVFAGTAEIGQRGSLSWNQLRALHRTGRWDLGSHARNGEATVATDAQGTQAPFLQSPRWIVDESRPEASREYRARVSADLEGSVEDFASRGLPTPRLFAFRSIGGVPPSAGQPVPTELRQALFSRFSAALVDTEPASVHSPRRRAGYVPGIRAGERSPAELVATLRAAFEHARPPASERSSLALRRRAIEAWSDAVNSGDFERAARSFAPAAVVEQTGERVLTSPAAAVEFNRRLPCRAEVDDVREAAGGALASFRLLPGRTGACAAGGRAQVRLTMSGGRFLAWRQLVTDENGPAI